MTDQDPSATLRINTAAFTLADGRDAVEELLDREQPDAIFGANDVLAIAAQMLLDRLRDPDLSGRSVTVAPLLTVRASSAARRMR